MVLGPEKCRQKANARTFGFRRHLTSIKTPKRANSPSKANQLFLKLIFYARRPLPTTIPHHCPQKIF